MDAVRQIRFVTPVFFFVASLILGAWLSHPPLFHDFGVALEKVPGPTIVAIAGLLVAVLFPVGFAITAISTFTLRGVDKIRGTHYQASLFPEAWTAISRAVRGRDEPIPASEQVQAALTFDHELLHERIHDAAVRQWSTFNIAVNSFTALWLAIVVGSFLPTLEVTYAWGVITALFLLVFALVAYITWHDHMDLLNFQATRVGRDGLLPHQKLKDTKPSQESTQE